MAKTKNDNEYLNNLRHSAAHLLAAAVMELYPNAKRTIGPAIENGFYYDFDNLKVSEEDLPEIEAKMHELVKDWKGFERKEVSPDQARKDYKDNPYKLELIDEFTNQSNQLTYYFSGSYSDLCRGGHIKNPSQELKHFKLLKIAGAYWRGDEKNKMLTRIYGTAFPTKEELDNYLEQLKVAEKNDHRIIGKDLKLFATSPEVGQGLILWLPNGTIIKDELEKLGKETEKEYSYQRVSTPHIARDSLYIASGHLPYYAADMYPPMKAEEGDYYLKPMNCPHMHMIFKAQQHTYKELPIRYAEFGSVYRMEDSGTLFGLMRVRGMTQNDAHIYCSEDQVSEEITAVMKLHDYYYKLFGIKNYYIELALPDFKKKPNKYFNDPKAWEKAVDILRQAAKQLNLEVKENIGGAAFYGPKFDFNIKSTTGREFGASTNQLDFGSGERFKLSYVDRDGSEKIVPYIIHRAPLGSDERFIGFLIEHFGGAFPTWLSPVQTVILPIADRHLEYSKTINEKLLAENIRSTIDDRAETLSAKIRDAQLQKVPYMLIIGDEEMKNNTISERGRSGKNYGQQTVDEFIKNIKIEIVAKTI